MRLAFGTDESTGVTAALVARLRDQGHVVDTVILDAPWPQVGRRVAEAVNAGQVDAGIVCCWTGTGVSIAANKVVGIRAALCTDAETARGARRWNDANVLALSLRLTSEALASEIVDAFLEEAPDEAERDTIAATEPD